MTLKYGDSYSIYTDISVTILTLILWHIVTLVNCCNIIIHTSRTIIYDATELLLSNHKSETIKINSAIYNWSKTFNKWYNDYNCNKSIGISLLAKNKNALITYNNS